MAESKTRGEPGLILDFPGAAETPHVVGDLPGTYRTDRATPVGGIGECTLEQAKAADKNPDVPLRLVTIPAGDVDGLRLAAANDRRGDLGTEG